MSAKELGLVSNNESTDTKCKYHLAVSKKLTLRISYEIDIENDVNFYWKNVFEFPLKIKWISWTFFDNQYEKQ